MFIFLHFISKKKKNVLTPPRNSLLCLTDEPNPKDYLLTNTHNKDKHYLKQHIWKTGKANAGFLLETTVLEKLIFIHQLISL